ncbi:MULTISPECIES: PadR family transcriptional regulator [Streptomycetaceae]|uniref:PadR family transcriptional regulator n=1 Tax=Streptomycetaceae TaxID=2062 RepID=UPI000213D4BF|nr:MULTISPECIES: helix-turn-helix transcriptional regulator [Streptomycetaceae]MYS57666.1 PadR family transcriptional regulator [Streptomyces sp. SID5468]CCB73276.1 Transcriptional regulator, PadR-like family [Streptantibioticus cattleyicolor NRRL 8057 = DSM 46488]
MASIRLTRPTLEVLQVLLASTDDDPAWGLRICEEAALGSGTVYPILDRLTERGWIASQEEVVPHPGRPARRFYTLTGTGRKLAEEAVRSRLGQRGTPSPALGADA